jgi:hypothetical protein
MVSFIAWFRGKVMEQEASPAATEGANGVATRPADTDNPEQADAYTTLRDPEKPVHEATTSGALPIPSEETVSEREDEADLPDDVRELPKIVRSIVSLEDDPTAPTITFRYFLLSFIFVPPGAILYQMGAYRTTSAVYPVLFVQIGELAQGGSQY